jgi:mono/diheme cytochrome c family protein
MILATALWSVAVVPATAVPVDYARDVKPLLAAKCYRCHGPLKQESGLRLDTVALLLKGGERGAAMVAGRADDSLIIKAIRGSDEMERMPAQSKPLTDDEIGLIAAWIDSGAAAPVDDKPADPREHWAFRAPIRPELPLGWLHARPTWPRGTMDTFIAAGHSKRGLRPQVEAPRHALLRRAYLDLIGLPPSPDQSRAFRSDGSPDAFERVVDRLLASPLHGQRWARHWMDVWRYSDWAGWTDGGQIRDSQPHIWRWRDWIVESLNADAPYAQMVVEMLAADELPEPNQPSLRATGFLARNYKMLSRETWMQDAVEHTAKAFLGLTVNCARCHDHMYDPLLQEDYYQMRAIFEPHQVRLDRVPGQLDTKLDGLPRVYDGDLSAATHVFIRGDDRNPDKDRKISPGLPRIFADEPFVAQPVKLSPVSYYPDSQPFVRDEFLRGAEKALASARTEQAKQQAAYDQLVLVAMQLPQDASRESAALALANRALAAAEARLSALHAKVTADQARFSQAEPAKTADLAKRAARAEREAELAAAQEEIERSDQAVRASLRAGDKSAKKQLAQAEKKLSAARGRVDAARKALTKVGEDYSKLGPTYPEQSTGRRLALARWIARPENPLTARVAVNHIWLRHFGQALVATPSDFGKNGKPPTNPALLDWLAVEFGDWSMKRLHRMIVTSAAYRLAATSDTQNRSLDPDNADYWQWSSRRIEAETVRDCVLSVAGGLDLQFGGPEADCAQGLTLPRRSLYFRHAPEKQMEFLKLFDAAAPTQCYQRQESIMPQQALALANSRLSLVASRRLARRLSAEYGADAAQIIAAAFEHVLSRPPSEAEAAECGQFIIDQTELFRREQKRLAGATKNLADLEKGAADPQLRTHENLVHALLNHHEFVTLP